MLHDVKISKVTSSDLWDNEVIISSSVSPYSTMSPSGYRYITDDEYESMGIYPYDPNNDCGCDCGLAYEYDCEYDYDNGFIVPIYSVEIQREKLIDKIFNLNIEDNVNILANYWPK